MNILTFIDTEIEPNSLKVLDMGAVKENGSCFHHTSLDGLIEFLTGSQFVCGHNIFNHDLKYIGNALHSAGIDTNYIIDTLFLSPLLFPNRPYHALVKDDKLQTEDTNNPLNDAKKVKDLFFDEITAFQYLEDELKNIYYLLLNDKIEFTAFFKYLSFHCSEKNIEKILWQRFTGDICQHADLTKMISDTPVELAYSLSLISAKNRYSITPPWVLKNFPSVENVMHKLRNSPCLDGCTYCNKALNSKWGLKRYFGYDAYRSYGGEPLQEKAVQAAIDNKSILAVFPTGGGKSITFQVPALMSGENVKGLTVIISPLQSLMKDQVDNLEKAGITDAVTINGLLDPIERSKSFERVQEGNASILYISPESLRSRSIERLLLGRKVVRFVIDEAHCFSSWGQDFRVDYLYIGDFILSLQQKKNLDENIPVSCFTATAKQKVIEDICDYFRSKLSLELELFTSKTARTNLQYKVFNKEGEEEKYQTTRDLIEENNCPVIIYVSRTRRAIKLAERLSEDGFMAKPYHGKMDSREKTANQNAFTAGEIPIMVATSAFGMGVDKKDVGMVIHYDISDSLENYIQEAGRAGRDENIIANCFVLYNEEDLSKHFILLNQTKLSLKEIQQVWKAIKEITKFRATVSNSALEIARKAGWDDNVVEIETRVTTAIAALEAAGYLKRGQNMPRIFANSILSKNAQEAIDKINASGKFTEKQKEQGIRIIKKLFSSKSKIKSDEDTAESRIDYISDHLGIVKEEIINIINLLREEKILADTRDLTAFIKKTENINRSLLLVDTYSRIENFLLSIIEEGEKVINLKEINEEAESIGIANVTPGKIKTVINFWAIKNWIRQNTDVFSKNHLSVICITPKNAIAEKLKRRHSLARYIIEFLFEKSNLINHKEESGKEEKLVEFSVYELKEAFENALVSFGQKATIEDVEDSLFYLSRIEALKIEGGFLVVYNRLQIERTENDNYKRYTKEDYQKLNQFYENKIQQIHIVGEYAKKMIADYKDALQFVEDYFQLNYSSFLKKYFPGSNADVLKLKMTPGKFKRLFGELSPTQLKIIKDNETKYIAVAAGPGSGKTRVLVHKLASLLLMEDVKHDQLLMLTFSRAASAEFKKRLLTLIGNAANFIEIKTFHSYCFDLLGKVGSLEKSDLILKKTIEKIKNSEVEICRITKTVLVIDEAQDMDENEFNLIRALMQENEEMRVIAVGDDDQNIYEFRGASSKFLEQFIKVNHAAKYELIENYRSKSNLVEFANQFVSRIQNRLKVTPIIAKQNDHGKIKLIKYQSKNLLVPAIADLCSTGLTGTTCVLTNTNQQALQLTGMLLKEGVHAKLIQSNEDFYLGNLSEIRFFLNQLNLRDDIFIINDEVWENAKMITKSKYKRSDKWEVCQNMLSDFEAISPLKKYRSDFEVFIRESRLEDFYNGNGETIFVSTIHKAKGKEFDNVFLILENFNFSDDGSKRLVYVAMTRAKQNLTIYTNSCIFDNIHSSEIVKINDGNQYSSPVEMALHLSYKDVWLDYFISRQKLISELFSGDTLYVNDEGCKNSKGDTVLKFSNAFQQRIIKLKEKNFLLKSAKVNFIVYWQKAEKGEEIKVVLPEVVFERQLLEAD